MVGWLFLEIHLLQVQDRLCLLQSEGRKAAVTWERRMELHFRNNHAKYKKVLLLLRKHLTLRINFD